MPLIKSPLADGLWNHAWFLWYSPKSVDTTIFCKRMGDFVAFDGMRCNDCEYWFGSIQGEGVECVYPDRIEEARLKYRPNTVNFLFVAEAPPPENSGRFFYFEDVIRGDSLFLEMMKVLYPNTYKNCGTKGVRKEKVELLKRFREDGCYLIDACDTPMSGFSTNRKRKEIQFALDWNIPLHKINDVVTAETRIILISFTVYDEFIGNLKITNAGFNIVNGGVKVPFPGSGQQRNFQTALHGLMAANRWIFK